MKECCRRANVITKLNSQHSGKLIKMMRDASAIMRSQIEDNVAKIESELAKKLAELKAKKKFNSK